MKVLKRVVLPIVAATLMITAVILVACASMKTSVTMVFEVKSTFPGVIWGIKEYTSESIQGGGTYEVGPYGPAVLPLIGWILILVGLVVLCAEALLIGKSKNDKMVKCLAICSAIFVITGGIFQLFALNSLADAFAKVDNISVEKELEMLGKMNAKVPLCTAGGILALVGGVVGVVPAFLPEK